MSHKNLFFSKLDIYKEPEGVKFEAMDAEQTPLEENVSKVRKVVWNYTDRIKVSSLHIHTLKHTIYAYTLDNISKLLSKLLSQSSSKGILRNRKTRP